MSKNNNNNNVMEITAKTLDLTSRSLDLLAVLGRLAEATGGTALVAKELGRWLGKEGLAEEELELFLNKSRALVIPNTQDKVVGFFQAIDGAQPSPSKVLPFWAFPSGSLGRLIARDPLQRWITSTTCCLFRYHNEAFIKGFLSMFLVMSSRLGHDQTPLPRHILERSPEKLQLDAVVKKVVESNWTHIANAGLIGTPEECPKLPAEFEWACVGGHNIEAYNLATLVSKLCNHTGEEEIIIQSEHLLTNLVLWLLWHHGGRLRVVVSGCLEYERVLGSTGCTVECRVGRYCPKAEDQDASEESGPNHTSHEWESRNSTFEVFQNVGGNLQSMLLQGLYGTLETGISESWARQKLYEKPFTYPKASRSMHALARRSAQLLLQWFVDRPVEPESKHIGAKLAFRLLWDDDDTPDTHRLKVGHLLGRTPQLLNEQCADLGRPYVVFSGSGWTEDDHDDDDDHSFGDGWESEGELHQELNELLGYFPMLQDLVDDMKKTCNCSRCRHNREGRGQTRRRQPIHSDASCFAFKAIKEVLFYFSHGIADAFGADDATGSTWDASDDSEVSDSGAVEILQDAVYYSRSMPGMKSRAGTVCWHTLLSTAARVFMGCPPLRTMLMPEVTSRLGGGVPWHTSRRGRKQLTIVAVQCGGLAVAAPWLDISQRVSVRGCFRFHVIRGSIALQASETQGRPVLRALQSDISIIETQQTESVVDFVRRNPTQTLHPGTELEIGRDDSKETYGWFLIPVDQNRHKLLLRVQTGQHSRMVEPSRAILQQSRKLNLRSCDHVAAKASQCAEIPLGSEVELSSFESLVGRWIPDPEYEPDQPTIQQELAGYDEKTSSRDSGPEGRLATEQSQDPKPPPLKTTKAANTPKPRLIQASQILDSFFKVNTALALTDDNPVLVNRGRSCLECSLKYAVRIEAAQRNEDHCDGSACWLINQTRDPAQTKPQIMLPQRGRRLEN